MGAPVTAYDLEEYGCKLRDVGKINLCIYLFCLQVSFMFFCIYYYMCEY